jgi:protein LTV1
LAKRLLNETESTTTITLQDDEKDNEKWDCESILTTYSNTYNHPKLITQIPTNKIRLSKKTGLPLVDNNKIVAKEEEEEENDDTNQSSIIFERKKGETSEERRARKHAIKEIRKVNANSSFPLNHNRNFPFQDRRIIKKATKIAFKQEEQKQLHEQALNSTQAHLQSLRVT